MKLTDVKLRPGEIVVAKGSISGCTVSSVVCLGGIGGLDTCETCPVVERGGVRIGDSVTFTDTFIDSLEAVNWGEEADARSVAVDNELSDDVEDVVEGIGGAVRNGRLGAGERFNVHGLATLPLPLLLPLMAIRWMLLLRKLPPFESISLEAPAALLVPVCFGLFVSLCLRK